VAGACNQWQIDEKKKCGAAWFLLGITHKDRLPASGLSPVTVAGPPRILTAFRYPRGKINIQLLHDKVKQAHDNDSKLSIYADFLSLVYSK
jgi:hypothetical protein